MGSGHSHSQHSHHGASLSCAHAHGHPHTYSLGENVLLIGDAKSEAQHHGLSEIVKILHLCQDQKTGKVLATVQLYKEGIPEDAEGGVGIPVSTAVLSVVDQIVPFPYFVHPIDWQALFREAEKLSACPKLDILDTPKKFCISDDAYDVILSQMTEVKGPVGSVRYSMLSHPTQAAPPIIIATIHGKGGVNRYGMISLTPDLAFKTAFLQAYGLPLTSFYYNAVPWHRIPPYMEFIGDEENQPYICKEEDHVWIYHKIKDMLESGYQSVVIRLPYPA